MLEIMVGRQKLISITSFFRFDIDAQKPSVLYMIHGLTGDLDPDEIKTHQILITAPYLVTYIKIKVFLQLFLVLSTRGLMRRYINVMRPLVRTDICNL